MSASFDLARVDDALRGTRFFGKLHHFPSIDSTNTYALAEAAGGAEAGHVYIADEQTAGRGRGGHAWVSDAGDGLYMSVLLRPAMRGADALMLSLMAGVAVHEAVLEVTGVAVDLRWPNDIVVPCAAEPSRKLGGILTETAMLPSGALRHAVIGVGLNLNQRQFPEGLAETATSLRLVSGHSVPREDIVVALLRQVEAGLGAMAKGADDVRERFTRISSWVRGKRVHVAEDGGYTGVTDGLEASGLLRVRTQDGSVKLVRHGGVREHTS